MKGYAARYNNLIPLVSSIAFHFLKMSHPLRYSGQWNIPFHFAGLGAECQFLQYHQFSALGVLTADDKVFLSKSRIEKFHKHKTEISHLCLVWHPKRPSDQDDWIVERAVWSVIRNRGLCVCAHCGCTKQESVWGYLRLYYSALVVTSVGFEKTRQREVKDWSTLLAMDSRQEASRVIRTSRQSPWHYTRWL